MEDDNERTATATREETRTEDDYVRVPTRRVEKTVIVKTAPTARISIRREIPLYHTMEHLIGYALGTVEVLLAFRVVLKLLGANPSSSFVLFIYDISSPFVAPFEGIFRRGYTEGVETTGVLEPATLVAMIVYAVVVIGFLGLMGIFVERARR